MFQVNNSSSGMVEGGESQELLLHEQHQEGEEGTHGRQVQPFNLFFSVNNKDC